MTRNFFALTLLLILLYLSCSKENDPFSPKNENSPPVAAFAFAPDSGDTATTFMFDGSTCSDQEDSTSLLKVRWNWNNDDQWDTEYSTIKTASHRFETAGIKKVTLEVMDSKGLLDSAANYVYVSVTNAPPTAAFNVTPDTGDTRTEFLFDASASHDNEDSLAVLQLRWDWENDGSWDTDYSVQKTINYQFPDSGLKSVALEVKDSGGMLDMVINHVLVSKENTPPTALFNINPDSGDTDDTFEFDASASFDKEDPQALLQVRWDWENDRIWDSAFSVSKTASHQFNNEGKYDIALEIKDSKGLSDTTVMTLIVSVPNQPPVALFDTEPGNLTIFAPVLFDASASYDFEDSTAALNVRWDWQNDDIWDTAFSTEKQIMHQFETMGEYSVKLEVRDSGNLSAFKTKQISVAGETGTVSDIDNNVYITVKIGEQWWMAENLKVTHYNNGDPIPNVTAKDDWKNLTDGAYSVYDNDSSNVHVYGRLYNWYAVTDTRGIAPEGWHIPTDEEWQELVDFLKPDPGGKMKQAGSEHWFDPNPGATNESGFTGLGAGYRYDAGTFEWMHAGAFFWSSTQGAYEEGAWLRHLNWSATYVARYEYNKRNGTSIRCIKD